MSLEKNQEYEIIIEDIGNDGEGIGRIDGMAVFVKDAMPGDVARIKIIKDKKKYAYGRLMEIIAPSKDRVNPVCPHARACGGCSIMHVSYKKQLAWKQDKVANCMKRIGGIDNPEAIMEPIVGMSDVNDGFPAIRYRNKAQFPVGRDKNGNVVIGFYAGRTHSIIDTDVCYLQHPINDVIVEKFRQFLVKNNVEPYDEETHSGLVRHLLTRVGRQTGEVMLCIIVNGKEIVGNDGENIESEFVECMKDIEGVSSIILNVNQEKTNKILGDKCRTLWGKDTIEDYIGNVKYQIGPLSFYQVNPAQTEKLYSKALEYAELNGDETVWDLYCGIGTISLFLAQKAKRVMGVEIIPEAIDDARKNAKLNDIENVEFFVGKAEEVLPREYEKNGVYADVIVVDPPRKGCDIVTLETMLTMSPKKIVYVSCDPATLARDIKILTEKDYTVRKMCAFDQFSHSGHVETVVQLVNIGVKPDYTVRLELDVDEFYKTVGEEKRHFVKPD